MREITERDRIPLLVGGTMLYFKALTEGLNELPEADPMVRLVIDTMAEEEGWPAVHEKLARVDPETAARLEPNDAQRIQRALEIYYSPASPWRSSCRSRRYVYFPYTPIKMALMPSDREELHRRIEQRFDEMLELGLAGEVEEAARGIRARAGHAFDALRRLPAGLGLPRRARSALAALREQGIAATRQLAKRQLTWLRSDGRRHGVRLPGERSAGHGARVHPARAGGADRRRVSMSRRGRVVPQPACPGRRSTF